MSKGEIEETVKLMKQYNITPTIMNENLIPIIYNPRKENLMKEIPAATKTKVSKLYTKLYQ